MRPPADRALGFGHLLLTPRSGPGVCGYCFNLTRGQARCFACENSHRVLDAVVPISYSVSLGQVHQLLAGYKRTAGAGAQARIEALAAILSRFLDMHEPCVARAAGVDRFALVTTVPSSDITRDEHHPLRGIVSTLAAPTTSRLERLLVRSPTPVTSRVFNARRYDAMRRLHGEAVLLIDDTWTTGASAQSAASALKAAGAGTVAAVVVGRHINRDWHQNDLRLRALARSFRWDACAVCLAQGSGRAVRAQEAA